MAWYKPVNLLVADPFTLAVGIDASQTNVTFSSGASGYLGTSGFGNGIFILIDFEIMIVTAYVSGESYTVTRAQGGTSGAVHTSTTAVNIVDVAELYTEMQAAIDLKVTGPATATDNAIARYDLTTGELLQDSGVLISDTNNITGIVDITTTGNGIIGGTLAVNGAAITSDDTTFGLLDATVTTVNAFGAATTVDIGAATGTTSIKNNAVVDGTLAVNGAAITTDDTTFGLLDATATTVNAFGAATTVDIGAATGTTTVKNNLAVDGTSTLTGKVEVGGGAGGTGIDLNTDGTATFDGAVGIGAAPDGVALEVGGDDTTQIRITGGGTSGFPLLGLRDEEVGGSTWNIENGREGDGILGFFLSGGPGTQMSINSSGVLNLANMPTSSAGLSSGDIWANSNVLTIVP